MDLKGAHITVHGDIIENHGVITKTYKNGVLESTSQHPAAQHAQDAEVVEDVVPVTTPQPSEEPIVETTDTDESKLNTSTEYTHAQLLDLVYKEDDSDEDKVTKRILLEGYFKKTDRAQYITKAKVIGKFIDHRKQYNLDNLTRELQAKVITAWAKELGVLHLIRGGEFKKGDVDAAY